jgi:hypothetical protein
MIAGKSTLAAAVARDIRARFDDVVWITVGRGAGRGELRRVLQIAIAEVSDLQATLNGLDDGQASSSHSSLDALASQLQDLLAARCILVVFDDVCARDSVLHAQAS